MRGDDAKNTLFLKSQGFYTQGCPLAMVGHGLTMLPLIKALKFKFPSVDSPWHADDASAAGNLDQVIKFFHKLCDIGPSFGYFPEESKSILIIRSEKYLKHGNIAKYAIAILK